MEHILFILGLPRSGTTLLQRILSTSPEIATEPEPWLFLPFLSYRESRHHKSVYGTRQSNLALEEFLGNDSSFEKGLADYLRCYLGGRYSNYRYFCEKTPRNLLYTDRLRAWFPRDKYIVLNRNPLDVAASIFKTFESGVLNPYKFKVDLELGLRKLVALNKNKNHSGLLFLRYEDLVKRPRETCDQCMEFLKLGKPIDIDGPIPRIEGQMGDPTGQFLMSKIHPQEETSYLRFINSSYRKWWFLRFLKKIGPVDFSALGYDYDANFSAIQSHKVKKLISLKDLSFLAGRKILEFITFRMLPRRPEERPDFILY